MPAGVPPRAMRPAGLLPALLCALVACSPSGPPPADTSAPAPASASASASVPAPVPASAPVSVSVSVSASASAPAPLPPGELPATIGDAVRGAIARGEVPGAVVAVVKRDGVVSVEAHGLRSKEPDEQPMTEDAVFDLASLTKAVVTAPLVHKLVEEGKIRLGDPVARHLPGFGQKGKEAITVEELLLHTSGLVADNAVAEYQGGRERALARIDALALAGAPGAAFVYSDVGYVVLGALVEKVAGTTLDDAAARYLFGPLGMRDTAYRPGPELARRAAPTEREGDHFLQGEVHDPRARLLGGVAGHAGLFSTARDLARFARMLLNRGSLDGVEVLKPATVARMTAPHNLPGGAIRALGWDVQPGRSGYGHTGFTGTSMWIDPAAGTAIVLLTSRLHPDGKGDPRRLRREVAGILARGNGKKAAARGARVLTGIDVLERDGFRSLRGRRVGLVTNPTGVDRKGASTIDVLRAADGVTLVALFSPEHGLRGNADRPVPDGTDERTGLPVYSLYGTRTRPTREQLEGLDTIVLDLQDAGARFYTYVTTLGHVLEAAAESGKKVVVLDRPNPIGGAAVEGPVLEAGRASFVGYHPLPVRHGMTLGELAHLFNQERGLHADLEVIRMEGWSRGDTFDRTDLRWVNPSPNLRSVTEALLYPGVALLETTNVSVGRGTDHPFEQVGAPYIDGPRLAATLAEAKVPGVHVAPTSFTPVSSVFAGQHCGGVSLRIDDRARFSPIVTGLALARALAALHPGEWRSKDMLAILGHAPTLAAIERGDALDAIVAGYRPGLEAFLAVRRRYLLYPGAP